MVVKPGGATPEVLTAACNKAWSDVAYFFKVLQLPEKDYLFIQDYSCQRHLVHPAEPVSPLLVVLDCACKLGKGSLHVPPPCCAAACLAGAALHGHHPASKLTCRPANTCCEIQKQAVLDEISVMSNWLCIAR